MNILICDDHQIVRDGLKQILGEVPGVDFIAEAGSAKEAIDRLTDREMDLLLLDISLPDQTGIELLKNIKNTWPQIKVLMLSMHPQEQYAIRALSMGASGYLTKDVDMAELILAVRKISQGDKYLTQAMAANIAMKISQEEHQHKHEQLSTQEFLVMIKLANGKSLIEIGHELCISDKTVSTYRSRVLNKMDLQNNPQLTRYCIENNLL